MVKNTNVLYKWGVFHSFSPKKSPKSWFSHFLNPRKYYKIHDREHSEIIIEVTDQNNNIIDFNGEKCLFILGVTIRDKKGIKFIFKYMVVIINSRCLFVSQHGYGLGRITYNGIRGDGIIRHSIKNSGKLLFSSERKVFNFMKLKAITFVKDSLKDINPTVEYIVVDKSTKFIHDVFNKPNELKLISKEIIKKIANERKEKIIPLVEDNINNTVQKSHFDLIHGKGVKKRPLSKQSRQLLKIVSKQLELITEDYWNIGCKQLSLLPIAKGIEVYQKIKIIAL